MRIQRVIDAAWQARREGRLDEAERGLRAAIDAARDVAAAPQLIDALGKLAHVMRDLGRPEAALRLFEEAVRVSREAGDRLQLAHAVRHLGDLHRDAGSLDQADRCYDEALAIYRYSSDRDALDFANALRPAALVKERQGDRGLARTLFAEARDRYREAGIDAAVHECSRCLARLE
jgi:tetratricopeptide (TPR) repeat protein